MTSDFRDDNASIRVFYLGWVPRRKIKPLLRELKGSFPNSNVESEGVSGGGGPLPSDLVMDIISIIVAGAYAKGFFARAGEAHYDALHARLSRLLKYLSSKGEDGTEHSEMAEELPRGVPLAIVVGRVYFHFQGKLTPEEVAERLRRAQEYVDTLPEQDLQQMTLKDEHEAGGPRNLVWDPKVGSWVEKGPRSDEYS